jgi:hypothetical protein
MSEQRQQALQETAQRIMEQAQRRIWITFRMEGIHKYPAALTDPSLATGDEYDVSFLGYPHRHIFHFRVWIDVFHNDRDIEFIQFKRWLLSLYTPSGSLGTSVPDRAVSNNQDRTGLASTAGLQLDYKSCEMIADELYTRIADRYPGRSVWIEVAEDGENGCLIKYETHRPNLSVNI